MTKKAKRAEDPLVTWALRFADYFNKHFPPLRENRLQRKRRIRSYRNPRPLPYGWHWRRHMQAVGRQHQSAVVAKRQRRSRR